MNPAPSGWSSAKPICGATWTICGSFCAPACPSCGLIEPEGTYFAWVDCSGLGLDSYALNDLILHKAKLWLDAGHIFGKAWAQYQRIVLACPRSTLEKALTQLEGAIQTL